MAFCATCRGFEPHAEQIFVWFTFVSGLGVYAGYMYVCNVPTINEKSLRPLSTIHKKNVSSIRATALVHWHAFMQIVLATVSIEALKTKENSVNTHNTWKTFFLISHRWTYFYTNTIHLQFSTIFLRHHSVLLYTFNVRTSL